MYISHSVHDLMPVTGSENLKHQKQRAFEVLKTQTTPILKVVSIRSVPGDSERMKTLHPNNTIEVPMHI